LAKGKYFIPLKWRSIISEASYNTIFQILFGNGIEQLKILYEDLRKQFSLQDYRLMKKAIKEERKKVESERKVLSVLVLFETISDEKKEKSRKRINKRKNLKKRAKKNKVK